MQAQSGYQRLCKIHKLILSITATERKHAKRQSFQNITKIPAGFKIFFSSPWHWKYSCNRWGILQIEINYTDRDISVLFIHFYICFPENIRKPFGFLSLGI